MNQAQCFAQTHKHNIAVDMYLIKFLYRHHRCVLHCHGNTFKLISFKRAVLHLYTAAHFITKSITAHNSVSHMQDFHCKEVALITKECVSTILVIVIQLHGYSGPNCKYVLLCVYIKSCYQETVKQ